MMVDVKLDELKETKPQELVVRFLFGGACTVIAGLIAKYFGPGIGGLFLAFPAIFPATASLIENHEKKEKAEIGEDGTERGRLAASVDAAGTSLGCIGLAGFALVIWRQLPLQHGRLVLAEASFVWVLLSVLFWLVRKRRMEPQIPPSDPLRPDSAR